MIRSQSFKNLLKNLERLPGVGNKSAERLAYFLLSQEKEKALSLAESIREAIANLKECDTCNLLSEENPCPICNDPSRDESLLCIVESSKNVFVLEKTGKFSGKYFVLGNLLNPMEGIGPEEIGFDSLKKIIDERNIEEIIFALNPSIEGETTMQFLSSQFDNYNIKLTRLSTGLPFGGNIDYSNSRTLGEALNRRFKL